MHKVEKNKWSSKGAWQKLVDKVKLNNIESFTVYQSLNYNDDLHKDDLQLLQYITRTIIWA